MDYKAIQLQLRQVDEAFSRSRINIYSDSKKKCHFEELHALFTEISKINLLTLSPGEIEIHYNLLSFVLNGLEYLDNSTLNVIPYELVSCLELALNDWIEDDNFIIVTSLSNKHVEYLLSTKFNSESFLNTNRYISSTYGLKITNRLIRITLPKSLSRDYLSSVVLYHELGHFIDLEYNISQKILLKKYPQHIPLPAGVAPADVIKEYRHTLEFFADLFAAQYVNQSSNLFLQCITTTSQDGDSDTHPATTKRLEVVDFFLAGTNLQVLNEFNDVLTSSKLPNLQIRHTNLDTNTSSFINLIPQKIQSAAELHAIFKLAWDVWINSETNFLKEFDEKERYHIINNLVEKSISIYTIKEKWNRPSSK
jgi:hypothetical protein